MSHSWSLYTNDHPGRSIEQSLAVPEAPPWRRFDGTVDHNYAVPELSYSQRRRGEKFRLPRDESGRITAAGQDVLLAVNAAIHLRRPLLVTGQPGIGKSSLAYSIAHELGLGRVLWWPITPRSELEHGLYRYEALDRLRDSKDQSSSIEDYITLGPLGTAFLPLSQPRVLLIDEIDKSDLQLPNELLHLFEEGTFTIPQLRRSTRHRSGLETTRRRMRSDLPAELDTDDDTSTASIYAGKVCCYAFPIVVMTSNEERDFPPAFYRRCIRVEMPTPSNESSLINLIQAQFGERWDHIDWQDSAMLKELMRDFLPSSLLRSDGQLRAIDQFLNAAHLLIGTDGGPYGEEANALRQILFRALQSER